MQHIELAWEIRGCVDQPTGLGLMIEELEAGDKPALGRIFACGAADVAATTGLRYAAVLRTAEYQHFEVPSTGRPTSVAGL
ncbi:MAG: hypothetical protein HC822_20015 [Oscillochloris sp.]|nr:hypothetical protein [Oscillochloris sp.]